MEIDSTSQEKSSFTMFWCQLKGFPRRLMDKTSNIAKNTIQIGKDDPRKIWHAAKVGLTLALVLLFYYSWPLYHSFEQSAIMVVLTVMVAFEYTAGATISKCLNIAFATVLGGTLGIGAKYLAEFCGKEGEPIVLGVSVFTLGALGTFTRFYPHMQRRYDYGCMLFVATFSLITVSGDKYLEVVKQRMSAVMVSVATVMVISMVIRPVWAGEDLHKHISANLEKLASFLDGFEREYFHISEDEASDNEKGFLETFKSVLGSKATVESLANFAWWEPAHGLFRFNNPGKVYLKIGNLSRDCACHLHALSGHLKSKSKAPTEFHRRTEEACKRMIKESSNALKDLAFSIKTRTQPSSSTAEPNPYNAKFAISDLRGTLVITTKTFSEADIIDFITTMSVASILIDVITCVDKISKAVEELSIKARFKKEEKKKKKKKKKEEEEEREDSWSTEALEKPLTPRSQQLLLHRGIVNPVFEGEYNINSGDSVVEVAVEEENPIAGEHVVCEIHAIEEVMKPKEKGEHVVIGVDDESRGGSRI
ncbi:aluminum-activated malate transporter 8-like [Lycium ferocissimum]|uniref:aluminum-activated malate transporter 8-like n=1 Tax=Lycium ferocissimum TaxID=112874 RepID=UPI0028168DE9|nr:aluminum-activated malate transporter 8-like [Lycium ferocissimum]